ncbi:hypothetical protein EV426DRAFT_125719 [Tirmania nivea]|nr:hypothetical protein EV426DRAFT_125719 [Tirmania nivea]
MAVHPSAAPQAQFLPPHITIDQVTSTFVTAASATTLGTPLDTPAPGDDLRRLPPPETPSLPPQQAPRTPIRRDSLRQREALLKGTPGSRRRQRWENDRLLANPHVVPPTPADFLPAPTHTRKTVHYDLACLWEAQYSQRALEKRNAEAKVRTEPHIPRELKAGLKKARGAVGIVRMLEERVREFVDKARRAADAAGPTHDDGWEVVEHSHGLASEDEHEEDKEVIVFTPKKYRPAPGVPHALPIYHSPPTDPSAPFVRWLVHSIAEYYGLHSWSVTEKTPPVAASAAPSRGDARGEVRVAYVGLGPQKEVGRGKGRETKSGERREVDAAVGKVPASMPRPLWVML